MINLIINLRRLSFMKEKNKLKYDRFCINDVLYYINKNKDMLSEAYKKNVKKKGRKNHG